MSENKTRLQSYKTAGKSIQDLRTRRHDVSVELRKSKKEDQMLKRRNIEIGESSEPTSPLKVQNQQSPPASTNMTLEEIFSGMEHKDISVVFQATQAARKMLSRERNPPINVMVSMGIVPLCTRFLDCHDQ